MLTINGGSSSIRFAVYESGDTLRRQLDGKIDRIGLRTFESVPDLIAAILEYLDHYNRSPRPFVWTKDADTILAKIDRAKSCLKVSNA